jgi:hypothetical protein
MVVKNRVPEMTGISGSPELLSAAHLIVNNRKKT